MNVRNMESSAGNLVPNQFIITTAEGVYFQSYRTVIAFVPVTGKVKLDHRWDCSRTTGKYRNKFLGENTRETRRKIKAGEYEICNLN